MVTVEFVKIPIGCFFALEGMSEKEVGRLFKGLAEYLESGSVPSLNGNERHLFPVLKAQADIDIKLFAEAKERLSQIRSNAGKKGGRPRSAKQEQPSGIVDAETGEPLEPEKQKNQNEDLLFDCDSGDENAEKSKKSKSAFAFSQKEGFPPHPLSKKKNIYNASSSSFNHSSVDETEDKKKNDEKCAHAHTRETQRQQPDVQSAVQYFRDKINPVASERTYEKLEEYEKKLGTSVVIMACNMALDRRIERPVGYIHKVLDGWESAGVRSVEDVEAIQRRWKEKNQKFIPTVDNTSAKPQKGTPEYDAYVASLHRKYGTDKPVVSPLEQYITPEERAEAERVLAEMQEKAMR